jgi:hypothetical protein
MRDRRLIAWVMAQAVSLRLLNLEVQLRSQFYLRFMVDKMTLGQFFLLVLRFSYHPMLQLIIYTLLLPEGQTGEAWVKYLHLKQKRNPFLNRLFH